MDVVAQFEGFVAKLLWMSIPLPVVIGSLLLLRRFGGVPPILLLIGSAAFLLERAVEVSLSLLLPYIVTHQDTLFVRFILPTSPTVFDLEYSLLLITSVCFPIGFIWFTLRFTRRA